VLAGGFVAGAIYIGYACAFWAAAADVAPQRILQSVAAGAMGSAAFEGGDRTAALGLALHFFIALSVAVVYFAAARRWRPLIDRPWLLGMAYGVVVYLVMQLVVVPLSAAAPGSRDPLWTALSVLVHAVGIGVPSALGSRAAFAERGHDREP